MPTGVRGGPGGGGSTSQAARALEALFAPVRFATRDGFAALPRLSGFQELLRGAVERARAAGAPDSGALRGLAAEAERFDQLTDAEKRR